MSVRNTQDMIVQIGNPPLHSSSSKLMPQICAHGGPGSVIGRNMQKMTGRGYDQFAQQGRSAGVPTMVPILAALGLPRSLRTREAQGRVARTGHVQKYSVPEKEIQSNRGPGSGMMSGPLPPPVDDLSL